MRRLRSKRRSHLHPKVVGRLDQIDRIVMTTHESAIRIISKTGVLNNPADRDHCLQYMAAIGLLKGNLVAEDYEDDVAADPRVDKLRDLMVIEEDPRYSREYHEPDKRSIANADSGVFQGRNEDRKGRRRVSDRPPPSPQGRHSDSRRQVPAATC